MWVQQPPESPIGLTSEFYWFFDPVQKKKWVVELWPRRYVKHYHGLWWSKPIEYPPPIEDTDLSSLTSDSCELEKTSETKKKRGRPAKTK